MLRGRGVRDGVHQTFNEDSARSSPNRSAKRCRDVFITDLLAHPSGSAVRSNAQSKTSRTDLVTDADRQSEVFVAQALLGSLALTTRSSAKRTVSIEGTSDFGGSSIRSTV